MIVPRYDWNRLTDDFMEWDDGPVVMYADHVAAVADRDAQWVAFLRGSGSIAGGLLTTLDLIAAGECHTDALLNPQPVTPSPLSTR